MNNRWIQCAQVFAAGLLLVALAGCNNPKAVVPPGPVKFDLAATATPVINRDAEGNPLSVVIRLYMLKDKTEFSKLTFDMVTSNRTDAELLGQDFVSKTELLLVPGATQNSSLEMPVGTKYVGLVAFFRKPDANYWRYLVNADLMDPAYDPIKKKRKKDAPAVNPKLSFKVDECFISTITPKAELIPGQPENGKPSCSGEGASAPVSVPATKVSAAAPAPATAAAASSPKASSASPVKDEVKKEVKSTIVNHVKSKATAATK